MSQEQQRAWLKYLDGAAAVRIGAELYIREHKQPVVDANGRKDLRVIAMENGWFRSKGKR